MSGYDDRPWNLPDGPDDEWRPRTRSGGGPGGQRSGRRDQRGDGYPADTRRPGEAYPAGRRGAGDDYPAENRGPGGGRRGAAPDPWAADTRSGRNADLRDQGGYGYQPAEEPRRSERRDPWSPAGSSGLDTSLGRRRAGEPGSSGPGRTEYGRSEYGRSDFTRSDFTRPDDGRTDATRPGSGRSGPGRSGPGRSDPPDGPDPRRGGARTTGRQRQKWGWKKKSVIWASGTMGFVLLAVGGTVGYAYMHFNGNIKSTALLPKGQTQPPEIPNKFGQTPLNILVMGSDTRDTAADCQLGHDCPNSGANAAGPPHADVEMVVHLAADRSNMTVMSIPRDTIVKLPSDCAHGQMNLINAALNYGPACQVEEVRELTGLTIDGYVMADMGAVVGLSNAIGPVQVCVTNNVYDSYSGLKLSKGQSQVVGIQALQWLRSRHAFGDEVYREQAQHYFLSAMIRKLESEGSFSNVSTLYSVADAATKSLTVSQGLDSVMDLLSLAKEMGQVPTSRITMLTMPWENYTGPNAAWRTSQLQVMQPQASEMFAALRSDQPYTKPVAPPAAPPSGGSTASPPAAATGAPVDDSTVKVSVVNDSGTQGRALAVRNALISGGFTQATDVAGNGTAQTVVDYPAGRSDSAAAVANALGIPAAQVKLSTAYSQVTVLVGKDWQSGTRYGAATGTAAGAGSSAPAASQASAPPDDSYVSLVSNSDACMNVPTPEWH